MYNLNKTSYRCIAAFNETQSSSKPDGKKILDLVLASPSDSIEMGTVQINPSKKTVHVDVHGLFAIIGQPYRSQMTEEICLYMVELGLSIKEYRFTFN